MRTPAWRLTFRLALLAYLAIISFLAFAPLASTPGTGYDKANHILAFFVLAGLADPAYPGSSPAQGWGNRSVAVLRMRNGTSQSPFRLALGDNHEAPAAPLRVRAPSRRVPCGDGRTLP